jgi:signal peptidase I
MAQNKDTRPFRERNRIYIYPVILALIVTMYVRPIISDGIAMEPAVQDGEVIIVSKQTYTPKRGAPDFLTVVAFMDDLVDEGDKGDNTIRRVVGVPGDTIKIENGKVYRNGEVLTEDYAIGSTEGVVEEILLQDDEVFVLGDNRENSIDSRDERIGAIKMDTIRGDCWLRVWPLSSFGTVK